MKQGVITILIGAPLLLIVKEGDVVQKYQFFLRR
jgi:hypothetical protein